MKSANWISGIGILPAAAIPTPIPMIRASASGVLKQRSFPNASVIPLVALNAPPFGSATSSPKITASGWAAITSCNVWLMAGNEVDLFAVSFDFDMRNRNLGRDRAGVDAGQRIVAHRS